MEEKIAAAKAIKAESIGNEKYVTLQEAISVAETVLNNSEATQLEIDSAVKILTKAIEIATTEEDENDKSIDPSNLLNGHVYSLNFSITQSNSDTLSMMDDYVSKPLYISVENNQLFAYVTLLDADLYRSFQVKYKGDWVTADIVDKGTATVTNSISSRSTISESNQTAVIKFPIENITSPVDTKVHVVVESINYDHEYDVQLNFALDTIQDVTENKPSYITNTSKGKLDDTTTGTGSAANSTDSAEKPILANTSLASQTSSSQKSASVTNPNTGISSNLWIYLVLLFGSSCAVIYLERKRRIL